MMHPEKRERIWLFPINGLVKDIVMLHYGETVREAVANHIRHRLILSVWHLSAHVPAENSRANMVSVYCC